MSVFQIRYGGNSYPSGDSITRDDRDEVLVTAAEAAGILGLDTPEILYDEDPGDGRGRPVSACFQTAAGRAEFMLDTDHALWYPAGDPDALEYVFLTATPVLLPGKEGLFIPLHALAVLCGRTGAWNADDSVYTLTDRIKPGPDMTFYLTRHGRTWFNTVGRVQGWCDSLLTEEGEEVAGDLGLGLADAGIHFTAAYSGDLGRQRQTARIVLDSMEQFDTEVRELRGLREACFGDWEGEKESYRDEVFCSLTGASSIFEIYRQGNLFNRLNVETDKSGTAETSQQTFERIMDAFCIIREENPEGGSILIISSGGAITELVRHYGFAGAGVPNAAVTYIDVVEDIMILRQVGDMSFSDRGRVIREKAAAVSSM